MCKNNSLTPYQKSKILELSSVVQELQEDLTEFNLTDTPDEIFQIWSEGDKSPHKDIYEEESKKLLREFNPYWRKTEDLFSLFSKEIKELIALYNEISWYQGIDLAQLEEKIKVIHTNKDEALKYSASTKEKLKATKNLISEQKRLIKPFYAVRYWLNPVQRSYKAKLKLLKNSHSDLSKKLSFIQSLISELRGSLSDTEGKVERFNAFDLESKMQECSDLLETVDEVRVRFERAKQKRRNMDGKIFDLTKEVHKYRREISSLRNKLSEIKSFEKELELCKNSYERAMIHKECSAQFSDGNPGRLRQKTENQVRGVSRNLDKCILRIENIVMTHVRSIKKVIIDGNNLCYQGEKFIGFRALMQATRILSEKYGVLIVFDRSICKLAKKTESNIRKIFPDNVEIHIVSNAKGADETILELASLKITSFVISNDRFAEFFNIDVVKENRLIRHEIIQNRLLIHELEVNVPW